MLKRKITDFVAGSHLEFVFLIEADVMACPS